MSAQGNGERPPYEVRFAGRSRVLVTQLHVRAAKAGKGREFLKALRRIITHLQESPLTFGEPLYRLPALKLLVRQGAVLPLVVTFGVHDERPLVFIRGFKVLS